MRNKNHNPKTLVQKIVNGVKVGAGIGLGSLIIGCTTLPQKDIPEQQEKDYSRENISNIEYSTIDQSEYPYTLEEQVLYGSRQYFQKGEEKPGTLPMTIFPYDNTVREIDCNTGETTLSSRREYVPTLAEKEGGQVDQWVDGIKLKTTGNYPIKADITSLEELNQRPGTLENKFGYKIITTQDHTSFVIKTIKILGEEYFFPHKAEDKIKNSPARYNLNPPEKLDYYLIPVKGASFEINSQGQVTIMNENQIYELILKSEKDQSQSIIEQK
jgi:hypothetical protein